MRDEQARHVALIRARYGGLVPEGADARIARLQTEVDRVQRSASWRMTRPLRALKRLLQRDE
jgi:hypothetical protein